jgi:hypothetical protein
VASLLDARYSLDGVVLDTGGRLALGSSFRASWGPDGRVFVPLARFDQAVRVVKLHTVPQSEVIGNMLALQLERTYAHPAGMSFDAITCPRYYFACFCSPSGHGHPASACETMGLMGFADVPDNLTTRQHNLSVHSLP